jgi:tetratricopeptide (TPR) repeat protein
MRIILYPILIILFNFLILFGNLAYKSDSFENALSFYKKAADLNIDDEGIANYNAGNSSYKLEEYCNAAHFYTQAKINVEESGKDKYLERILYNLANALYKCGQENPDETQEQWEQSLENYEQALEKNPENEEAQQNKSIVEEELKNLNEQNSESEGESEEEQEQDENEGNPEQNEVDEEQFEQEQLRIEQNEEFNRGRRNQIRDIDDPELRRPLEKYW